MDKKLFYAILFFQDKKIEPKKYRNCKDDFSFEKFAQNLNAWYVNFYNKDKSYSHRKYFQSKEKLNEFLAK